MIWRSFHKFKSFIIPSFLLFLPISFKFKKNYDFKRQLDQEMQKASEFVEEFLKILCENVLKDPQIIKEGFFFFEHLARGIRVREGAGNLLLNTLRDAEFNANAEELAKKVVEKALEDPVLKQDFANLVTKTIRSPSFQYASLVFCTSLLSSPLLKPALIDLFNLGTESENVRSAFGDDLKLAFYEILMDKRTLEKFKAFWIQLMEKEAEEDGMIGRRVLGRVGRKVGEGREEEGLKEFLFFSLLS